jgi:hypothetical protein
LSFTAGTHPARWSIAAVAALAALLTFALTRSSGEAQASSKLAPIGIMNAFGAEQAPILAEMKVTGHKVIDGLSFWEGTIGGYPVNAATYGNGPSTLDKKTEQVLAFAAPKQLVTVGAQAGGLG